MVILNILISTERPAVTQDAQGTSVEDWANATAIDTGVPASLQQLNSTEIAAFSRRGIDADFAIYTRTALAAILNDRATGPDGSRYAIKDKSEDMAGRGRMFCTPCKRTGVGS